LTWKKFADYSLLSCMSVNKSLASIALSSTVTELSKVVAFQYNEMLNCTLSLLEFIYSTLLYVLI